MVVLIRVIALSLCCIATTAAAVIYKCEDKGKISYQDSRCESGTETIITDRSLHQDTTNNSAPNANTKALPAENTESILPPAKTVLSPEQVQQILNSLPKANK